MQEKKPFSFGKLLVYLLIPLAAGGLSAFLVRNGFERYAALRLPPLSPPGVVFPVVWSILFLLMGYGAWRVSRIDAFGRQPALVIYGVQLAVNVLWPVFFFGAGWYLFAFLWLVILWGLVLYMVIIFYKMDKTAALLQIPYLLWLTFAGYLNLAIVVLNGL